MSSPGPATNRKYRSGLPQPAIMQRSVMLRYLSMALALWPEDYN
jgi:hypothetical protein